MISGGWALFGLVIYDSGPTRRFTRFRRVDSARQWNGNTAPRPGVQRRMLNHIAVDEFVVKSRRSHRCLT